MMIKSGIIFLQAMTRRCHSRWRDFLLRLDHQNAGSHLMSSSVLITKHKSPRSERRGSFSTISPKCPPPVPFLNKCHFLEKKRAIPHYLQVGLDRERCYLKAPLKSHKILIIVPDSIQNIISPSFPPTQLKLPFNVSNTHRSK